MSQTCFTEVKSVKEWKFPLACLASNTGLPPAQLRDSLDYGLGFMAQTRIDWPQVDSPHKWPVMQNLILLHSIKLSLPELMLTEIYGACDIYLKTVLIKEMLKIWIIQEYLTLICF